MAATHPLYSLSKSLLLQYSRGQGDIFTYIALSDQQSQTQGIGVVGKFYVTIITVNKTAINDYPTNHQNILKTLDTKTYWNQFTIYFVK